ncbi:MAG TPA: enoyl-CoA hydratase/isomerase family protein [Jiangellaceae bacterium]|nr:enoyl-CoA hydratase/isomerase family protein [Jiangellaceae bacterium]
MPTEGSDPGGLLLSVEPPVARVTLARPASRNAQTPATWRALAGFGESLPDGVRVVVLDAQGPSFSAGLDRRMLDGTGVPGEPSLIDLATRDPAAIEAAIAEFQAGFTWLRDSPAVSVAAVQGHAVGAGFQLALACDLILCAEDARFSMRETSLGLVPDLGGTAPLVAAVGYPRALEICATGRWVDAGEAVGLGLAIAHVPGDELPAAVDDLVQALLAAPAGAVRETKSLLREAVGRSAAEQLAAERAAQVRRIRDLAAGRN